MALAKLGCKDHVESMTGCVLHLFLHFVSFRVVVRSNGKLQGVMISHLRNSIIIFCMTSPCWDFQVSTSGENSAVLENKITLSSHDLIALRTQSL